MRRPNQTLQEEFLLAFDHVEFSATTAVKLFTADRPMRVDRVEYVNVTGLAEHADNYWEIELLIEAAVAADWSTDDAEEGTIAADTFADFTDGAAADRVADTGDLFSLSATKVASAANLPAGRVVIHGRYL